MVILYLLYKVISVIYVLIITLQVNFMKETVESLLSEIVAAGKAQGLDQKAIVAKAGLGASTLSKAKAADDMRVSTLARLAAAVGLRVCLTPHEPTLDKLLSRSLFTDE